MSPSPGSEAPAPTIRTHDVRQSVKPPSCVTAPISATASPPYINKPAIPTPPSSQSPFPSPANPRTTAAMTTYMPSITIPSAILEHPASSVLLPIALGTAIGFATRPSGTQKTYMSLKQPPLRPPPWVFGPVWTVLYGVMGYAAHRAFTTGLSPLSDPETVALTRRSMTLYSIQLGLNLIWMPLFFAAKRPVEASVDILGLVGLNGYLAYIWGSIDRTAGLLQIPYLAWLSFATYLCVGAGHLNGWDFSAREAKTE